MFSDGTQKYTVQRRAFLFFWMRYEYGVNEGGGSYIAEFSSLDKAIKFMEGLENRPRSKVIRTQYIYKK